MARDRPALAVPRPVVVRDEIGVRGAWLAGVSLAVTSAVAGCAVGDDALSGTVVVVQDVAGFRDTPVTEGFVAAVPWDAVDDVFASAPRGEMTEPHLGYLATELPWARVLAAGGAVAEIRRGRFELEADAGEPLVCVAAETGSGRELTRGCDRVDLPASGVLAITFGEAPVHVEVEE